MPAPLPFDDPFSDTRMPFGDHIEELRGHLWRALAGYAIAVVAGFFFSRPVFEAITGPVERGLQAFHARRLADARQRIDAGDTTLTKSDQPQEVPIELHQGALRRALGLPSAGGSDWVVLPARIRPVQWTLATAPGHQAVLRRPTLTALTLTEPFLVYFKVSLVVGFVLACPWVFYQFWAFVGRGLYPDERRMVYFLLPLSVGLFLGGVALCQLVVLPTGVEFLLDYYRWLDVEPGLRLNDWLHFALWTPVIFGLSFQTPLVMLALQRLGLFTAETFARQRRLALLLLAVLAAALSVTPDWFNMLALALPLWGLYELGIVLCRFSPKPVLHQSGEEEWIGS